MIKEKWESANVVGWGGYVVKEKLKRIKGDIKEWVKENGDDVRGRLDKIVADMNRIDILDEDGGGGGLELARSKELTEEGWDLTKMNESILRQSSRCKWVKKEDKNTRYFHA